MTPDSLRGSVLLALDLSQTADASIERLWIASPSKRSMVAVYISNANVLVPVLPTRGHG
jgi:hypothetical protein